MVHGARYEEHRPGCSGRCGCWAAAYQPDDGKTYVDGEGWRLAGMAVLVVMVGAWGLAMWGLFELFG